MSGADPGCYPLMTACPTRPAFVTTPTAGAGVIISGPSQPRARPYSPLGRGCGARCSRIDRTREASAASERDRGVMVNTDIAAGSDEELSGSLGDRNAGTFSPCAASTEQYQCHAHPLVGGGRDISGNGYVPGTVSRRFFAVDLDLKEVMSVRVGSSLMRRAPDRHSTDR